MKTSLMSGAHVVLTSTFLVCGVLTIPATAGPTGACCLSDQTCVETDMIRCDAMGGEYQGDGSTCGTPLEAGAWRLGNHPDANQAPPPYGMRLDELFDATPGHDKFTFDFEAPGATMILKFDGTSIHIFGTAFGGLDIGGDYDPNWTSMVEIDFTYAVAQASPGDDDLVVPIPAQPNSGTITWLATNEIIPLGDFANDVDPFTFRFGNEDDDLGHRGFDGISGWGWLTHNGNNVLASDWLFTAVPLCDDGDDEGCTPGYWKNHHEDWPAPYTPDTLFSDVFDDAFPGMTLDDVLDEGGGGLEALGRHVVAALLNAASGDVAYPLTVKVVISMFNNAFPGEEDSYETLKNMFEAFNEAGCPL